MNRREYRPPRRDVAPRPSPAAEEQPDDALHTIREQYEGLARRLEERFHIAAQEVGRSEAHHAAELYASDPAEIVRTLLACLERRLQDAGLALDVVDDVRREIDVVRQELDVVDPIDDTNEKLHERLQAERGTYLAYLRNLGLTEDEIRHGHILDVGAGSRRFAGYCLRHGINRNVYSLEPNIFSASGPRHNEDKIYLNKILQPSERAVLDDHTVATYAEHMPFDEETFDAVVIRAGGISTDEQGRDHTTNDYNEICRVLKVGGEFRTDAYLIDLSGYDSHDEFVQQMLRLQAQEHGQLETLRQNGKFSITIEPLKTQNLQSEKWKMTFGRLIIKKLAA